MRPRIYWQSANGVKKQVKDLEYAHAINIKLNFDRDAATSPWIRSTRLYKAICRRIKSFETPQFIFCEVKASKRAKFAVKPRENKESGDE